MRTIRFLVIWTLFAAVVAALSGPILGADSPRGKVSVREAQEALKDRGFDPGPIDGLLGPNTEDAIREFQKAEGLTASGKLDEPTVKALDLSFKLDEAAAATDGADGAKEESERAQRAADTLSEILAAPDKSIPVDLLEKAHAVAVIPHVVKGAFVVGAEYGKGLISRRNPDGSWSSPAFIELEGGSVGFQIGASATDVVLVFTSEEGLKPLLKGKVKLGADASVAAGPVGRTAGAATDITLDSAIYSYSRSKGLFAGVALDGAALTIDDSANQRVYGRRLDGEQILLEGMASNNRITQPFAVALRTLPSHHH